MDQDTVMTLIQFIGGSLGVYFIYKIVIKEKNKENATIQHIEEVKNKPESMKKLVKPCQIILTRLSNFGRAVVTFSVLLNGNEVGRLKNGATLEFSTEYGENLLMLKDKADLYEIQFNAEAGGLVKIQFNGSNGKLKLV